MHEPSFFKTRCRRVLLAAVLGLAFAGNASAVVLYMDSFTRTGLLNGSAPDVTNTNGNLWQQTLGDSGQGANTYVVNGTAVGQNTGTLAFAAPPGAAATTVSIIYSASAGTIKFTVGGLTIATKTGVTAANIAALNYVSNRQRVVRQQSGGAAG